MNRPPLTDEDGEVRELTVEDFRSMQPISEVDPGMVDAMQRMKDRRGRPKVETPKKHVGFRLDAEVVDRIKATGRGYNARVERVLREALAAGTLDAERDAERGESRRADRLGER